MRDDPTNRVKALMEASWCLSIKENEIQITLFRLHRMHQMQTIARDVSVFQSVCHAALLDKTSERTEVMFEVKTLGGPSNTVLDGGSGLSSYGHGRGRAFDAAFAKLLWPLVLLI